MTTAPDSSKVATGDKQRKVAIWNAESKEMLHEHGHHKNKVEGLYFTPDSDGIASVAEDFSLVVCNLGNKKFH